MQYSILFAAVMATSVAASPALNGRQTSCEDEVNACRIAPGSNQAFCSAQYAGCLGYNPYNGTSTGTTSAPAPITTATSCSALYDACRGAPDANFATCAASYAGCLGYNPFDNSGSLNTTAPAYVTTVVTAITTYCPSATTLTYGNKTYTVPGPTTLTITDCPCTITTPVVPAGPGATTAPGVVIPGTTITGESGAVTTIEPSTVPAPQGTPIVPTTIPAGAPSTTNGAASGTATGPASYTGGADIKKPAFGLLALGVLALL